MDITSIEARLDMIEQKFAIHSALEEQVQKKIQEDLLEIKTSMEGLVAAWNAAGAAGHFLKWISMVVGGYFAIIEVVKMLK